jgi:AspT/YidE/YbjL antiporter-like protein
LQLSRTRQAGGTAATAFVLPDHSGGGQRVDWLVDTLQQFPEISIFLTLAVGYGVGSLKVGSFSLGSVTGTLLMGVLVGQLQITISPSVKATCFLVFLFFVGYGVGPQFFQGLRKEGLPQILFAALQCAISLATGFAVAKTFGYDVGQAAGLLAGSQTVSALLGTATDAINRLTISGEEKRRLLDAMTVAYAVTYIFGTAGTAWILSALGPRLVGGNVTAACMEYEARMSGLRMDDPEVAAALTEIALQTRPVAALDLYQHLTMALTGQWKPSRKDGPGLRAIATTGDLSHRTARAIAWLRANFAKPLHMEELASVARMGVSTLHHQFRALTAMSPLQYQKCLRLQQARRLLIANQDATRAGYAVGYESASQFSREYSRFFGAPPLRDRRRWLEEAAEA